MKLLKLFVFTISYASFGRNIYYDNWVTLDLVSKLTPDHQGPILGSTGSIQKRVRLILKPFLIFGHATHGTIVHFRFELVGGSRHPKTKINWADNKLETG